MNDTSYEQKIMFWGSQLLAALGFVLLALSLSVDHFKTIQVTGAQTTQAERSPIIIQGLAEHYSLPYDGISRLSCVVGKIHYQPKNGHADIPFTPEVSCDYNAFTALQQQLDKTAQQHPQTRIISNPDISIGIAAALGLERNKVIQSLNLDHELSDPAYYLLYGLLICLSLLSVLRTDDHVSAGILIVLTMIALFGQLLFHAILPNFGNQVNASTIKA
ncbi:MAG: hypothetical protein B7Z48_02945 [Thiotrichales bacterium 12-47-6]|nr:MAG: hypothetical protein B7Z48_02945 [Thiotrichales bacterium 12-47-6]